MLRELVRPASLARHLNMAGAGVLSGAAREALQSMIAAQYEGGYGARDGAMALYGQAREALAAMAGAQADELSFQPSVSAVVSMIAASVSLRPGDQVLSWAAEYPSNLQAWARRAQACDAQLVLADVPHVGHLAQAVTSSTRVVAVSSIQSLDGAMADLASLRHACDRVGALLLVDVSQHLGVVPFDFAASGADFAYGCSHKWLLGPPGVTLLMARRQRHPMLAVQVHGAGNYQGMLGRRFDSQRLLREDLGRLEGGTPPLMATLATAASARALHAAGVAQIQQGALTSRQVVEKVFARRGHESMPSGDVNGALQSPIIAFDLPPEELTRWIEGLNRVGVQHIERGGVLRFSPWLMHETELTELQALLEQAAP